VRSTLTLTLKPLQVIGDTRQAENMRIETVNLSNLAGALFSLSKTRLQTQRASSRATAPARRAARQLAAELCGSGGGVPHCAVPRQLTRTAAHCACSAPTQPSEALAMAAAGAGATGLDAAAAPPAHLNRFVWHGQCQRRRPAPAGGAVGAEDAAPRREDDDDAGLGALAREAGVADVKPEAALAVRARRPACLCFCCLRALHGGSLHATSVAVRSAVHSWRGAARPVTCATSTAERCMLFRACRKRGAAREAERAVLTG